MKKVFIACCLITISFFTYGQENRWGIAAYGGLAIPTGNFSNFYDNGYTIAGGVIYNFKFSTRLSVTLGYTGWELNNDEFNKSLEQDSVRFEGTAPIRTIPLLLQIKWYGTEEKLKLYGLIEAGFYFTKSQFSGDVFVADTLTGKISGKQSSTNTGLNLGIGVTYNISEKFEIDIAGRYHIVSFKNTYNFSNVGQTNTINSDQYWSITAGINVLLFE